MLRGSEPCSASSCALIRLKAEAPRNAIIFSQTTVIKCMDSKQLAVLQLAAGDIIATPTIPLDWDLC
jgi:hypothetical protein